MTSQCLLYHPQVWQLLMDYLISKFSNYHNIWHCVKSVWIRSFSGPYFPVFGLNTEIYSVNLRIQSECGKIQTRKTQNTDTFYTVWFGISIIDTSRKSKLKGCFNSFRIGVPIIQKLADWLVEEINGLTSKGPPSWKS